MLADPRQVHQENLFVLEPNLLFDLENRVGVRAAGEIILPVRPPFDVQVFIRELP